MKRKNLKSIIEDEQNPAKSSCIVEDNIEKRLRDIATLLCSTGEGKERKSRLYEDVVAIFERSLLRIALDRNSNVKTAAADYLGMNRNTFQKKMTKLGIKCENRK